MRVKISERIGRFVIISVFSVLLSGDVLAQTAYVGVVQGSGMSIDSVRNPAGSDPILAGMSLVRSIYFEGYLDASTLTYTTGKHQFAPAVDGTKAANTFWLTKRPKYFELWLWTIPTSSSRDSCWIAYGEVLVSDSLVSVRSAVMADSSNVFIKSGNYNNPRYGLGGLYEIQKDTTNKVLYPLLITDGAYIQIRLSNDKTYTGLAESIADAVTVRGLIRMWGN